MNESPFWGHFDERDGRVQPLREHLRGVAELARRFADGFGQGANGELVGWYHDIGKYSAAFQAYLREAPEKRRKLRGSVDHSTAGAQELMRLYGGAALPLAFCVAGHHGGIPDMGDRRADTAEAATLGGRLKRGVSDCSRYREDGLALRFPPPSAPAMTNAMDAMLYVRMLFSCLVDADFLDTEAFMTRGAVERADFDGMEQLLARFTARVAERFGAGKAAQSALNQKRAAILARSIEAGDAAQGGLFRMTIPTGGGKTVASLAFALHHAVRMGKKRILYVIPYTSIIEQNAAVFRDLLGDANVLEHHAQVDYDAEEDGVRKRLAAENWDAPVIVTTNVQFFESLFANRPSKCRKLHHIAESVVIFDEAQMIPPAFLRPSMAAIRALVQDYRVTAVLCTATQPPLEPFFPAMEMREIVPLAEADQALFRRADIRMEEEPLSLEALAKRLAEQEQTLCIVNTKETAYALYALLAKREGTFHLSTNLCPVDRTRILDEVRARLREGVSCRVVSTSLVEAGVDLDFPCVYREINGLDSIVQAAGRCNREGRRPAEESMVQVFSLERLAKAARLPAEITRHVAQLYGKDLSAPAAIAAYFAELYDVSGGERLDKKGILASANGFPFAKVAADFRFIEEHTVQVIVPIGQEAEALLARLKEGERSRRLMRRAARYMVAVRTGPHSPFEVLRDKGMLCPLDHALAYLSDLAVYDVHTGLNAQAESGMALFY